MAMKDRGSKKWTAMMLPEHVGMVKDLWMEDEKTGKPVLDEQQLQEIDEKLHTAMEYRLPLIFTLWRDGFTHEVEGALHYMDENRKIMKIAGMQGEFETIHYEDVIGVDYKG